MSKYIKPPESNRCVWRSGPPPEIGWWPANYAKDPRYLSWWDGKRWSFCAKDTDSSKYAGICATGALNAHISSGILWSDRWWLGGTWNRCETIDKAEVRRVAKEVLKDMPGFDSWFIVNAMVQRLGAHE